MMNIGYHFSMYLLCEVHISDMKYTQKNSHRKNNSNTTTVPASVSISSKDNGKAIPVAFEVQGSTTYILVTQPPAKV